MPPVHAVESGSCPNKDRKRPVAWILFRHDPIGISFEENTDKYHAEAATILKRPRGPAQL
jgi:hypothetical protein